MYLLSFSHGIHGDAGVRYQSLLETLRTGHLAPMVYSYVHPFLSAPLLLLGHIFKDGYWWVSRFNAFVALWMIYALWREAREWKDWGADGARVLVLLLLGATMLPKHVTDYYAEVFSACAAVAAVLFFQRQRSWLAILALSLSVWNVVATIFGGAFLLAFFSFRSKKLRYLLALPLLPLGFLVENYLKYGDFYPTAYMAMQNGPKTMLPYAMGPGFSYPLFFGLLNVFFSFGRGLIFFTPGLLALFHPSLWKKEDRANELLWASAAYLAGVVILYAKFWAWHGGAFWGPRYFLFASFLAALALAKLGRERELSLPWRIYWLVAVALSCWVACQGVFYGTDFLEDCYSRGHELEFVCFYVPEYSVLWRYFIVLPPLVGRRVTFLAFFLLVGGTLLWLPAGQLLRDLRGRLQAWWQNLGPGAGWRF